MMKLLITDDSGFMRELLTDILADAEHQIETAETAETGEEMLAKYEEITPDVVFLDVILPGMNGLNALQQLKEKHPEAKVVVCSAVGGQEGVRKQAMEAGAMSVIAKPFSVEEIKEAIADI